MIVSYIHTFYFSSVSSKHKKAKMKLTYDIVLPSDGERNLPPIIFLHGRLDSRKTWKHLAPNLATITGRKVYVLDARNHGESPWSEEIDFEILADDLDEFLTDHNIPKAILVGHSMGGRTAITLSLRKPEKVEKLIVEDMVTQPYSRRSSSTVLQIIQLLKKSLSAIPQGVDLMEAKKAVLEYIKSFLPEETSKKGTIYDLDTLPLKKSGDTYTWQANLGALEDMLRSDKQQNLTGVFKGEALFLYGTKSFFEVEKDESISKYFPGAVKVPFEGAGHLLHHDYPEIFIKEVSNFILGCDIQ